MWLVVNIFSNFDDTLKSAPGFSIVSNYDNILEYECMHIIILESCLYGSGCKRKFHGDWISWFWKGGYDEKIPWACPPYKKIKQYFNGGIKQVKWFIMLSLDAWWDQKYAPHRHFPWLWITKLQLYLLISCLLFYICCYLVHMFIIIFFEGIISLQPFQSIIYFKFVLFTYNYPPFTPSLHFCIVMPTESAGTEWSHTPRFWCSWY